MVVSSVSNRVVAVNISESYYTSLTHVGVARSGVAGWHAQIIGY